MSKKLKLNAAGDAATVTEATVADIFTTAISTTECVTGTYKLVQGAMLAAAGAAAQNYRLGRGLNFLKVD